MYFRIVLKLTIYVFRPHTFHVLSYWSFYRLQLPTLSELLLILRISLFPSLTRTHTNFYPAFFEEICSFSILFWVACFIFIIYLFYYYYFVYICVCVWVWVWVLNKKLESVFTWSHSRCWRFSTYHSYRLYFLKVFHYFT